MKASTLIKVAFLLLTMFSFGTKAETYTFRLVSEIDKSDFFSYQITKVTFSPAHITLRPNAETNTFHDAFTLLTVDTDIPSSDVSMKFQLFMKSNTAQCFDIDETALVTPSDFAQIFIAEQPLTELTPALLDFNKTSDGLKSGEYDVKLTFGEIPNGANICRGEFSVLAELSL